MRKRLIVVAVLAAAIIASTAGVALAHHPVVLVSQPAVIGRPVRAGVEFKVVGFVAPRQSEDTSRQAVVRVFKFTKGAHPRYSQVETVTAAFGWPAGKRWNTYDASLTVAAAGGYRLTAAIVESGKIIAQSPPRSLMVAEPGAVKPLFVSKPGLVGRHVRAGREFGLVGYVAPQQSADTSRQPVIQVFKYVKGSRPRYSQVGTVTAEFGGPVGTKATLYKATLTIADAGWYRLRTAIVEADVVIARSAHRPLYVGGSANRHHHH
jgi:hypothetical protein